MKKIHPFPQILFACTAVLFLSVNFSFGQCDTILVTEDQPYSENFESDSWQCWTLTDTTGGAKWERMQGSLASGMVFSPGDGNASEARIVSPVFNMSGISAATLSFSYYLYSFYTVDELIVSWRASETDTWHVLGTLNTMGMSDYAEQSYELENLSATYQISFLGRGLGGLMDLFTNVEIIPSGACARPTSVQASSITTTTAVLSWTANSGETSWTLELDGVESLITTNPFSLSGLYPQSFYTVRIKANCSEDNSSDWSTPIYFSTICDVITVTDANPYTDDFESSDELVCWTSEVLSGSSGWTLDPGYAVPNHTAFFIWLGDEARLISTTLDITAVTEPTLVFKRKQLQGQLDVDELSVWYRVSENDDWHSLANYLFPTDGFEQVTLALPAPSATYQIAFKAKSNQAEGVYVDDVAVGAASVVASVPENHSVIALYPNPTTGYVTVESDAVGADITVYDVYGKRLMTSNVAAERTELDFSEFATGIYMVRIAAVHGSTTVKVVKE